jgi:hypothetical protein
MSTNYFHLAGVIPVAGQMLDFQMDWSDCLMPLAPNYTAIERSVMECAYAGCETIWIVANDDVAPLLRHRVGEFVQDPAFFGKEPGRNSSLSQRRIPIFYVPLAIKDHGKRDCLSWSVIHGSLAAFRIGSNLSKWVAPNKYYVSFPYGAYSPEVVRPYRKTISSQKHFALTYEGKTVADGLYLGFTFGKEEFLEFRREIRKGTGLYSSEDLREGKYPTSKLPIKERYSARFFDLAKIFKHVILEETGQVPWYYAIDNWESYCNFLGSPDRHKVERPPNYILNYKEWNLMGVDDDE